MSTFYKMKNNLTRENIKKRNCNDAKSLSGFYRFFHHLRCKILYTNFLTI